MKEFVKKLHRRGLIESQEFFYAIEFHKNGWTHWHLAVRGRQVVPSNLNGVNMFLDSGYELPELWKYGMVNVSAPPEGDYYDPEHAMNYLTKYIAKQDVGPPDWVLDRRGSNFRKFSTSRGLCEPVKSRKVKESEPKIIAKRTARERAASCAQSSRVLEVKRNILRLPNGGYEELHRAYRFLYSLDEDFTKLKKYAQSADVSKPEQVIYWLKVQKVLSGRDWGNDFKTHDRYCEQITTEPERNGLSEAPEADR